MSNNTPASAIIFFGDTGDLAYKNIFPVLMTPLKEGKLNVPGWQTMDTRRPTGAERADGIRRG